VCRACGADDQVPDLLATLRAVDSAYLEFRRQSRAGMKRVLGAHTLALHERTKLFRIYEHNVIPGLFQTAEYSAAMLSFWIKFLGTTNDLEEAVATRMERQRIIYKGGKRFVAVLEEQALRTWFGTVGNRVSGDWVDIIHIEGFSRDCLALRQRTSSLILPGSELVQRRVEGSALDVPKGFLVHTCRHGYRHTAPCCGAHPHQRRP